jgi:uncharacterized protein (DUF1810 family)
MDPMKSDDPFNLERFIAAQDAVYPTVVQELKDGQKRTHWMWFIFPQVLGLGRSPTSQYYAIKSKAEAIAYLQHPVLGKRIYECAALVLEIKNKTATQIFGQPDNMKLQSSMTLFASISQDKSVFIGVITTYYHGQLCQKTIDFLKND